MSLPLLRTRDERLLEAFNDRGLLGLIGLIGLLGLLGAHMVEGLFALFLQRMQSTTTISTSTATTTCLLGDLTWPSHGESNRVESSRLHGVPCAPGEERHQVDNSVGDTHARGRTRWGLEWVSPQPAGKGQECIYQ